MNTILTITGKEICTFIIIGISFSLFIKVIVFNYCSIYILEIKQNGKWNHAGIYQDYSSVEDALENLYEMEDDIEDHKIIQRFDESKLKFFKRKK